MNKRQQDELQEKIMTEFITKHYFKKYNKNVEIVTDIKRQVKGIDIIADDIKYDLKAQLGRYINSPTDTFAFEISYINRAGKETIGWILDENLETEYYFLIWINKAETDENNKILGQNAIEEVEVMTLSRELIRREISLFLGKIELLELAKKMRAETIKQIKVNDYIKLVYSPVFPEKPVNIVIKKEKLRKIAKDNVMLKRI